MRANSNDNLSLRLWEHQYSGPGVLMCAQGECDFEVDRRLGCHDACHTRSTANVYQYPFNYLDDIEMGEFEYAGCSRRRHESASNITTTGLDIPIQIDEGCTATCTGCEFFPTAIHSGHGYLGCRYGWCSNYTFGSIFNDCPFDALEKASEFWGSLSMVGQGTNDAHTYEVYENINTDGLIEIDEGCTLECYGCSFSHRNLRGAYQT